MAGNRSFHARVLRLSLRGILGLIGLLALQGGLLDDGVTREDSYQAMVSWVRTLTPPSS